MRKRLIVLIATVALLLVGAVPVSAAPGGVPGPPPGHGKSDDVVKGDVETPDTDEKKNGPPEWAMAYGKRIKDFYGIPFGHLQQCARADAEVADGDEVAAEDEKSDDGEDGVKKKALENCPDMNDYKVPEEPGASAFALLNGLWVMPEVGLPILGL